MEGRIDGNAAVASDGLAVWFALNGRIVVFDTETTGLDEDDEILQLAAIEFIKGVQTRTFNAYINPVLEHDDIGTDIHGITEDFLKTNGRPAKEVLDEFFGFLGDNVLLVAHNIKFDMEMLRQECALCENAIWELRQVKLCNTVPSRNSTKVWLTKNGGALLADNGSAIPLNVLRNIMAVGRTAVERRAARRDASPYRNGRGEERNVLFRCRRPRHGDHRKRLDIGGTF